MLQMFINSVSKISNVFWGTGMYVGLLGFSLIWILFVQKNKDAKRMFGWYMVCVLALIYNPVMYFLSSLWLSGGIYGIKQYLDAGGSNYVRMFYAIPVTFVIAYGLVEVVYKFKNKWIKPCISILALALIIGLGTNVYASGGFQKRDNWCKMPAEVVDVSSLISQNTGENEERRVLVANDLIVYMRQYDASIKMPYGRASAGTEVAVTLSDGSITEEVLSAFIDETNCNYVVCNKFEQVKNILLNDGFIVVGETEQHIIMKK